MERRKSKRYQLRASVVFSWIDSTGVEHKCVGITLNISPIGVFVVCDESSPPLHTAVTLEVTLPSLQERRQGLHLKAGAQVLRAEETPDGSAFAAATDLGLGEHTYTATVQ
jgi:hypothetical protein